jgi:hypothetical protein
LYLTELTNITEMIKAMPTAPSAPLMEDQELVGHRRSPPPSYDQAMGQGQVIPPVVQPAVAPYPQPNSKLAFKFTYVKQILSVILSFFI